MYCVQRELVERIQKTSYILVVFHDTREYLRSSVVPCLWSSCVIIGPNKICVQGVTHQSRTGI